MAKGADIYSGFKRNDDEFPYEPVGVYRLLKDYYRLEERISPGGDYDTAVILADLKGALDSPVLTARQRQIVALLFFAELTMEDVSGILGVYVSKIHKSLTAALERLSAALKGARTPKFRTQSAPPFGSRRLLYAWLNAVGSGEAPIYNVPAAVMTDLLMWLDENGDEKAQEALRQHREGPPNVKTIYKNPEDEYLCLNPRQLRYRHEKEERVSEVFPKFDVSGAKKSAVKERDTGEWIGNKKKIYIFPR